MTIHISGQVVDEKENLIMTTDDMINSSLLEIEKFVKTHNLVNYNA